MTTISKCTIVLSVLLCMGVIFFGTLVFADHGVARAANNVPMMVASEARYAPPVEKEVVVKEEVVAVSDDTAPEEEMAAAEPEVEVEEQSYQESDSHEEAAGDDGGFSYDGSGVFNANVDGKWYSGADFRFSGGSGCDDSSGFSFTWYSEKVLPGGGLNIPGRHVGDEGYVCDENGNLCIASDDLPYGTVVSIPFGSGTGVVYDSGSGYGNLDIYVSW